MSNTGRTYDLILWGATGFVGRLVAEYLTKQYTASDVTLALGGRNERKLRDLEATLVTQRSEWEDIPIVLGDAMDPESLRRIAEDTRVVCTTVGPYTRYGTPLVEACVSAGTDYCDLTGEVNWIREMIDRYHADAVDTEARIVHSCGFDSIPADLGTKIVQSYARERFGDPCELVRIYFEGGRGGVSGGTLSSIVEVFNAASSNPVAREALNNPYSLAPVGERDGVDSGTQTWPRKDLLRGEWTAPSPMAVVNERVIRRTNALLEYPWGREFQCSEVIPVGSGPIGVLRASAIVGGIGIGTGVLAVAPIRDALRRFVFPDPGEGPTRAEIEAGYFTIRVLGRGTATDGPFIVECRIGADQDPGYGATARMLSEAAMCLVDDRIDSPLSGGILTPAAAIGDPLATGLRRAGLAVEVGEWDDDQET